MYIKPLMELIYLNTDIIAISGGTNIGDGDVDLPLDTVSNNATDDGISRGE